MPTGRINKRAVDAIAAGERDAMLWDCDLKGFGVKVTSKGVKTYLLQYRMGGRETPTRRYTIGRHGSPWTPDTARLKAQDLLVAVRRGVDPAESERTAKLINADLAFDSYVDVFIERYAKKHQLRSWKQTRQVLQQHAVKRFRSRPLPTLERREIARLVEDVAVLTPATGRYLHASLRKMFRWAVSRGDLSYSPMSEMAAPSPIAARDRYLRDNELRLVWMATQALGFPFGPIFRLLILTGQRREEIGGMRWSEVDLDTATWVIPAVRSKNGIEHTVPLNALAMKELCGLKAIRSTDFVFSTNGRSAPSGWSKAKARLDETAAALGGANFPHWRTHDLRRTVATNMQRLGVRFEVTEAILNHVSGARSGVAGVYQRHNWAAEKRASLEGWNKKIELLLADASANQHDNVLALKRDIG